MKRAVSFRLEAALVDRAFARAGELGQTRTKFVERALEAALGSGSSAASQSPRQAPTPPRAHKPEVELPKIAKRKW